jgi:CrcB protein
LPATLVKLLMIAVGGAVGAVARFGIGLGLHHLLGDAFPYGTLAVNVLGCFVLGAMYVTVGFLGALTTFSTFGLETVKYSQNAGWMSGAGNVAANLLLGLTAVKFGIQLGQYLRG